MAVFSMAGSNPALPTYPLQRSVRLRASATAYFNRTPASAGNRRTWTWSGWVKRGSLSSTQQGIFSAGTSTNDWTGFRFNNDNFVFYRVGPGGGTTTYLSTTQVFRDPSSWYHIVLQWDTTQATSSDRIKLYINGVQVTAFSSSSYPTLNYEDSFMNTAVAHLIGNITSVSQYFDGYLTEVNFIDGQALTPSSFGAYNSYGVWSPAKYTGSYGTNGFYLNFQDNSALTTTANVGIGKDSSGNGNYWTSNNISLTAGITYDSMLDVPTLTSNTNANYAVMNPLAVTPVAATFAEGNLKVTTGLSGGNGFGTIAIPSSGKWYWETTLGSSNSGMIGISGYLATQTYAWQNSSSVFYYSNGQKYVDGTGSSYGSTFAINDVIGIAVDADLGTVTFYKNNVSQGSITHTVADLYPCVADGATATTDIFFINFGQRPFSYTPPTGYNRLCTYNLPDSIVPVGAQYFAATTYTGNSAVRTITNTVNGTSMQPDLVWVKCRSTGYSNALFDSVRGANKTLGSNSTAAEISPSASGGVSSFGSNGFSLQIGTVDWNQVNTNADTYVGWQWRASNASAVTNTSGSITSQVSANQTAGFSIVTYTGTGANATVGHGLGVAPRMVIVKQRTALPSAQNWIVGHTSMGWGSWMWLDLTNGQQTNIVVWNNTAPTSSVFSVGTGNGVNVSTGTYVAYCFAAVPGYSAFGSYTGNGSTDGPFIYTGFRPRWVMVKSTGVDGWVILDTSRSTFNLALAQLIPNLANAEDTTNNYFRCDILSNGFKLRTASSPSNSNAVNYIYAAFSENPFKNSLAR